MSLIFKINLDNEALNKRMSESNSTYLYRHGISEVRQAPPMYSLDLTPPGIGNGWYEALEHEHLGKPNGTRVMVKKKKQHGLVTHYLTIKFPYGWIRQTVVFREGERDPFPASVDAQFYEVVD